MGNWCVNLIQKPRQSGCISNVILCQIRADDLAGYKVQADVKLAPLLAFGLCFMLVLQPLVFTKDLQSGTIDGQVNRISSLGLGCCRQKQAMPTSRQGREIRNENFQLHQFRYAAHQSLRLAKW